MQMTLAHTRILTHAHTLPARDAIETRENAVNQIMYTIVSLIYKVLHGIQMIVNLSILYSWRIVMTLQQIKP